MSTFRSSNVGSPSSRDYVPSIVFADMDGTFLTTSKDVLPQSYEALDLLAVRHVPFVPCTGRPVSAVPSAVLRHPATTYVVGSNGSVVYDMTQHQNVLVVGMDKERILALYERVRGLRATFDVFADGEVYAERARYEAMGSYGIDAPSLEVLRRVRKPVDLTVPQLVQRARAVEKITCFWCNESDRHAIQKAIEEVGGFYSAHGHPKNFELQRQGTNKGSALMWLCEHLGLRASDAVAFGDELNDVPMLEAAGDGVAMGNAVSEVLAAANHVAPTNDEAGVARYLMSLSW